MDSLPAAVVEDSPSEKVYYLAGPMSGIPQFNFPLFRRAANWLRGQGYFIISPAELDDEEGVAEAAEASPDGAPIEGGPTWGEFLARDVRIVADMADGIILLPGWARSRGARLEATVALECGHEIRKLYVDDESWDFLLSEPHFPAAISGVVHHVRCYE